MEQRKLTFESRPENLILAEKLVDEVCTIYKVSEDYYGNILIAVTEAVNNAINHGNKADEKKQVDVVFEKINLNTITFTIRDQGPGFDPDSIPDPTAPENIEKPNGRGIFLMKQLSDTVKFNDKGREVVLFFNGELKPLGNFLQSKITVRHTVLLPKARQDFHALQFRRLSSQLKPGDQW